jgi:hypothetical protein
VESGFGQIADRPVHGGETMAEFNPSQTLEGSGEGAFNGDMVRRTSLFGR